MKSPWIAALAFAMTAVNAGEPTLLAVMGNKVSVSFGGKPITLQVGGSHEGIKLVAISGESAIFESGGKRSTVQLGQNVYMAGSSVTASNDSNRKVTLFDAGRGHFMATLTANGGSAQGLIDTGATFLSLSARHASALGIKPDRTQPVRLSTAQGMTQAWKTRITALKIEGIALYNVEAVVHDSNFPEVALIGMSILNQMDMQRDGDRMTLAKKY